MTKEVLTAEEDATLEEIVRLMSEHQLRRIPVVKNGALTGLSLLEIYPSKIYRMIAQEMH